MIVYMYLMGRTSTVSVQVCSIGYASSILIHYTLYIASDLLSDAHDYVPDT